MLSVGVVAFCTDTVFNGNLFLFLALLSTLCALSLAREPADRAGNVYTLLAAAVLRINLSQYELGGPRRRLPVLSSA